MCEREIVISETYRTVLEILHEHNHICWYPNAGDDFREVLFLSDWYYEKYGIELTEEESLPDLFLLTDSSPRPYLTFSNRDNDKELFPAVELLTHDKWRQIRNLFRSNRTQIAVTWIEKLNGHEGAYFMKLNVTSRYEGQEHEYQANMLYVLENSISFFRDTVLRNRISLEYIINCNDWSKDLDGGRELSIYWLRSYLKYCNVKHYLEPASMYSKYEIEQLSDRDSRIIMPYLADVLGEMDEEYLDISKIVPYYDLSSRYPKPFPAWKKYNVVWSRVRYRNNRFERPDDECADEKKTKFHWIGINTDNVFKTYEYCFTYVYRKNERYIYMNQDEACIVYDKRPANVQSEPAMMEKEIQSGDFADAMRKLYIAHVLTYGHGISVESYTFGRYDSQFTVTAQSEGARLFPFIESMIGNAKVDLPIEKYETVLENILNSNKSEDLKKREIVSLFAFLKSENRDFVIDRFSDLWTSMNAFYGALVLKYNSQIEQLFDEKNVFSGINSQVEQHSESESNDENSGNGTNSGNSGNSGNRLSRKEILEIIRLSAENDTQGQKVLEKYICGHGARKRYALQPDVYKNIRKDRSSNFRKNYIDNIWPELDENQKPYKENRNWVFKGKAYRDIFRNMAENVPVDHLGTRAVSFYDFYRKMERDLFDEDYHNTLMAQDNGEEPEDSYSFSELVRKIEGEYGEYLYLYVLKDLSYHYRCVYFHGSQTGVMVEDRDGYENRRLTMLCDCLERFLADHIHVLFENFMFEGDTLKSICDYAITSNRNIRGGRPRNGKVDAKPILEDYLRRNPKIWD